MTLLEIKKLIDKLPPAELNKELYLVNKEAGIATTGDKIIKSRCDRYKMDWEDFPLTTLSEMRLNGLSEEEISEHSLVVSKGDWTMEF